MRFGCRLYRDIGELGRARHLVDESVGEQNRAFAREQHGEAKQHRARLDRDDPRNLVERVEGVAGDPRHHRVGIAAGDHAGGKNVAVLVNQPLAVAV